MEILFSNGFGKGKIKMAQYSIKKGKKTIVKDFKYLPCLPCVTDELDELQHRDFDIHTIRQITLWKLERYVGLSDDTLKKFNALKSLNIIDKTKTKQVLKALLDSVGIGLPMASTYLRFINPQIYQIIDARAYRAAFDYTQQDKLGTTDPSKLINIYIKYLDKLRDIADSGYHGMFVKFEDLDRFLYDIDKESGFEVKDTYPYDKSKIEKWQQIIDNK